MPLQIIRQDITKIECDAIVNPSNRQLEPGGGADWAIHEAAGEELYEACRKIGGCNVGDAVITSGFKLPCRYVIHTAGPGFIKSKQKEQEKLLASCYKKSLALAKEYNVESIAIPLISAGTYGFPNEIVLKIATSEIQNFLFENEMLVYLVVYNGTAFKTAGRFFKDIQEFIDDVYVKEHSLEDDLELSRVRIGSVNPQRSIRPKNSRRDRKIEIESCIECCAEMSPVSLSDFLKNLDETFAITLLKLIDLKGMTDVECYKRANVSKQTWYKIMNDKKYKPSKNTVIAFAISLKLTYDETQRLLATAGFTLSRSSLFDVIIEYFLIERIYDITEINNTLFSYDQVCLGC